MNNSLRFLTVIFIVLFPLHLSFAQTKTITATFAGGCFWCMEETFDKLDGVVSTTSGFTGGGSHEQVLSGQTGHVEAVEILYDPEKITYEKLLEVFWRNIDPSNPEGQFCDRGPQYRSGIFYHNEQQRILAEESKRNLEKLINKQVVTPVLKASQFFAAEENHQDFYKKNALRYKQYKIRCGRERRLRELWGD